MKKVLALVVALFSLVAVSPAFAVSVIDYAAISTAVTTELGLAFTAMAGVVGLILSATIGWRFFKRMTK